MKKTILAILSGMLLGTMLVIGVFAVLYFQTSDRIVVSDNVADLSNMQKKNGIMESVETLARNVRVEIDDAIAEVEKAVEEIRLVDEAKREEAERIAEEARLAEEARIAALPYLIKVNRLANCVTVYTKDEAGEYTVPVKAMVCSVGLNDETPLESGRISDKYDWRLLFGNVYGQYAVRFNGHIMFHSVPYTVQSKDALKDGEYNLLGQPASQGCIRLSVADAKWIYDNCDNGTKVEVYDAEDPGPLGKPSAIKIDPNSALKGWDPTDPDVLNPWTNGGVAES